MIGQGRPTTVCHGGVGARIGRAPVAVAPHLCALFAAFFAAIFCAPLPARAELGVRIAWGGGPRRQWEGEVELDRGVVREFHALGLEADEPGSMWIADGTLHIRQRSGRTYDACDLRLDADLDATLRVRLTEAGGAPQTVEVPLRELLRGQRNAPLDERGNRILLRRAPGDRLRVELERDALVFATGETFTFRVRPHLPELAAETQLRLRYRLEPARGDDVVWSGGVDTRLPAAGEAPLELPVEVPLPNREGAYRLIITAVERGLRQRLVPGFAQPKPHAERALDLVVVADEPPEPPDADDAWRVVSEIDPASPRWWERLRITPQIGRLPGWQQGRLRYGGVERFAHPLGSLLRLNPPATGNDASWEAYPLTIEQVGAPHLLEVEYPGDLPQHLGISIVEPNAGGAVLPVGLDSGVYLPASQAARSAPMQRHRLLFWPRTKSPLLLVTGLNRAAPSAVGKLRVLAGPATLPRPAVLPAPTERLVAGYLARPLFPENFSAPSVLDVASGQSIDDWETFYRGGSRLTDYLAHAGYNGLLLSVWADGSCLYPSRLLEPTPRYDSGPLATNGQDPIRKDGVEMLMRLFDREGLRLVPALQFAAPLPRLEALLRRGGPEAEGVEWVGADGGTWRSARRGRDGLAPYYNVLDPRVQEAMLDVVRELATRYSAHRALEGVALQLTSDGYAILPGPEWGFDEATVARFARDVPQAEIAAELQAASANDARPDRFARRARLLLGPDRDAWLAWRAAELSRFYQRVQTELATVRPGLRLYLDGAESLDGPLAATRLRPTLPRRARLAEVLLEAGIDLGRLAELKDAVVLRPYREAPVDALLTRPVDVEWNADADVDRPLAAAAVQGSLLYHPPQSLRLESFERQSPFGPDNTFLRLVAQPTAAGPAARRGLAAAIAGRDTQVLVDGGWMLPLGQEAATTPLRRTWRALPAEPFETSPLSQSPLTIRTLQQGEATYLYAVNESPWPIRATIDLAAPAGTPLTELGPAVAAEVAPVAQGLRWQLELAAHDVRAARLDAGEVRVVEATVSVPSEVESELARRIETLGSRVTALAGQNAFAAPTGADFERADADGRPEGWSLAGDDSADSRLDDAAPHGGLHAARLTSAVGGASLQSAWFSPPRTGRLELTVWMRVDDPDRAPPVRMLIEGSRQAYVRSATVGGAGGVPLQREWASYFFRIDDLPTAELESIRVRFDLTGPGAVWLDDVRLDHLRFTGSERVELSKIIVAARAALTRGELGNCQRLLESYWPRFLEAHVAPATPVARRPIRRPLPQPPPQKPGVMGRLKGFVPQVFR